MGVLREAKGRVYEDVIGSLLDEITISLKYLFPIKLLQTGFIYSKDGSVGLKEDIGARFHRFEACEMKIVNRK